MKAQWFNNYVCKNEQELLDRLDQAIADVIHDPNGTQKTTAIRDYSDKDCIDIKTEGQIHGSKNLI